MIRRNLVALAAMLVVFASMGRASGDESQQAREHYRRGTKLFDLQRYGEAAKEIGRAHV